MLICDEHHRLIDREDVTGHPVDRLRAMKQLHEQRIEIVSSIDEDRRSHVLLYGANIGSQSSPVSYAEAARAMLPNTYPADTYPIVLSLQNSSFEDKSPQFWDMESDHLQNMITQHVRPRLRTSEISHLSIFALAPQPLLILLGSFLSDIPAAEIFQLQREPRGWKWHDDIEDFSYIVTEPSAAYDKPPVLVFSLSATVNNDRVYRVLGNDVAIWGVTIDSPHNDFVKTRRHTLAFRRQMRRLMDRIKALHGENAVLHVFPAMPVSLAVEFGRIVMPKADLPLVVYDQNRQSGGFVPALDINCRPALREKYAS